MAGYIGAKQGVTQVDGYNRSEADAEFVQVSGDTMTGTLRVLENNAAPSLTLQRPTNTINAGDFVQGVRFSNAVDTWYSEVFAEQSTVYPDAIGLAFKTQNGAGNRDTRMRIDSLGRVTLPYQPCFVATRAGNHVVTSDAVVPLDSVDVNVGNHFNTSTYTFTAPVSGKYLFTLQTTLNSINTGSYNAIYILRNGGGTGYRFRTISGSGWGGINGSAILSLSANDSIKIHAYAQSGSMTIQGSEIHFGGQLIS